jgi:hypothetical protein
MALTMINPAISWFKTVELPLLRRLKTITVNGKESFIVEKIFNKTSEHIAWLVNKTWLSRSQDVVMKYTTMVRNSNCILNTNVKHMVSSSLGTTKNYRKQRYFRPLKNL